jgi:hypothetical protein
MVGRFSAGEDADVFPHKSWVHAHVMNLSKYPAIPVGLCQFHKVTITFVDFFEFLF